MRLVYLTTGTGSFYCGSCMRDNALVVALRKRGHDALLVPMYLPLTLDEASAAENTPLFYGGINSYLQQVSPLFRKTPRWLDKLFDAPSALASAGKRAGMTKASELGPMTLSMLKGEEGNQTKELERLVEWLAAEKPDWVILSNALLLGMGREIKAKTGAKVACTLQGEDGFLDALKPPYNQQCWDLVAERAAELDALIPVSHLPRGHHDPACSPASRQAPCGLQRNRPRRVPLTADPTQYPYHRLPSADVCPKGLGTLVDAFLLLGKRNPEVRLKVIGSQVGNDAAYVAQLSARLAAAGLAERVSWHPNVSREEKIAHLKSLSVLSVPATYGESFGLYIIEALAAGVPVVQPRHGAFPELLAETGGGVLCEPDSPAALADALEALLADPKAAAALGAVGQKTVHERFSVDAMAAGVEDILMNEGA